jgi:hypothetical protein
MLMRYSIFTRRTRSSSGLLAGEAIGNGLPKPRPGKWRLRCMEFAAIRDCQLAGSDTDLRLVHGHSQPTSGVFVRAAGGRQEIRASP